MIRLFEANNDRKHRDFENFLFSNPYGFEFDFSADKVQIYGTWYRISTLYITDADGEGTSGTTTDGGDIASNTDTAELARLKACVCGIGGFVDYPLCETCDNGTVTADRPTNTPAQ